MTDPSNDSPRGVWALSPEERRALALALLDRPNRASDGLAALRGKYPRSVPDDMVHTAAHHVYNDGPDAVVDFLADAELAIRDPEHQLDYGAVFHVLDHLYNWLQFAAIIPEGTRDLLDLSAALRQHVADKDWDAVAQVAAELGDILEGARQPPDVIPL
jgi:hypothetical protein